MPVLGLREEVGRDPRGVRGVIRNHENLARAGKQVHRHAPEHLALGLDDPAVAGAKNLLDRADGLGAESESSDRLRPADAVDFGGSALRECGQESGMHVAVAAGRRHGHDLAHARRRGEGAGHDR